MLFTKIEIAKANTGAVGQITDQHEEILSDLNSSNYYERQFPEEGTYKTPDTLKWNDQCHSTTRKFVEVNQGWEKVSGYLISRSELAAGKNPINLITHSVVKDINGNLLELMGDLYLLEDYAFICHASGSQGYTLKAYL